MSTETFLTVIEIMAVIVLWLFVLMGFILVLWIVGRLFRRLIKNIISDIRGKY